MFHPKNPSPNHSHLHKDRKPPADGPSPRSTRNLLIHRQTRSRNERHDDEQQEVKRLHKLYLKVTLSRELSNCTKVTEFVDYSAENEEVSNEHENHGQSAIFRSNQRGLGDDKGIDVQQPWQDTMSFACDDREHEEQGYELQDAEGDELEDP
jgi:hypothetical protein